MIELRHVRKEFDGTVPLEDVSTVINRGDIIAVIGPSGTGKSTLLRCINMLGAPTSGQIFLDGEEITAKGYDLTKARRKMGMVFQSFNLFGHMTVLENVVIPQMDLLGRSREEATDRALRLLETVGMLGRRDQLPEMLSGGQKQRAAIARTLAMDPEIILFDEPTSALDPAMTIEVQSVIRNIAAQGITMMIVTHNMEFARDIANRVIYMDAGGIYEDGTPEQIFDSPQGLLTRQFIFRQRIFEYNITGRYIDASEMISGAMEYCAACRMSRKAENSVRALLDEMMMSIIFPVLTDSSRVCLCLRHSDTDGGNEYTVSYNGERFNPAEEGDALSVKLIRHYADTVEYEWLPDAELCNRVTVRQSAV